MDQIIKEYKLHQYNEKGHKDYDICHNFTTNFEIYYIYNKFIIWVPTLIVNNSWLGFINIPTIRKIFNDTKQQTAC